MCLTGCKDVDPPSKGEDANDPCKQFSKDCPLKCDKAAIKRPIGSLDSSSNPKASWRSSPCYHFDFQGVVRGSPGPYTLTIQGEVSPAPPFACKWAMDKAAGTLKNDTSTTPTHAAPAVSGEGELRLQGMKGGQAGKCKDRKKVKIYKDHLARDRENFGTGISCGNVTKSPTPHKWKFSRFGATIEMPMGWNCHGSTLHHYNGGGTGSAGLIDIAFLLDKGKLKKEVKVTHTDKGGGSHPPLGQLKRGDIVAYFTGAGQLAHTQTCTGNKDETYGANNKPVKFPGRPRHDEAWIWTTSTAGDWANDIKKDLFPGATPFTIKVFSKP